MKEILFALLLLLGHQAIGQDNQFTTAEDSDPVAKKLLDNMKETYEASQSIEANFQLVIDLPEEDPEIQIGTLKRQGDKFRVTINRQEIFCDGKTLWVFQPKNFTVQINTFDPNASDDEILSPQNFMQFYDDGKFIAAPIVVAKEDGKSVRWIELKPIDADSEYFKFRISLDIKKNEVKQIKAFSKDGSRFTLKINYLRLNPKFDSKIFSFNQNNYPDLIVEDLRVD